MVNTDYWSRLGVDIDFDPLYQQYLNLTCRLRLNHEPPSKLPMLPENMPYYRGPRVNLPSPSSSNTPTAIAHKTPTSDFLHIQSLLTEIVTHEGLGHTHLSNIPIKFGSFDTVSSSQPSHQLYNSEIASYAFETLQFSWAVYSFSNGHFPTTIIKSNLLFKIRLACDVTESG
jgi:hypothetical protein